LPVRSQRGARADGGGASSVLTRTSGSCRTLFALGVACAVFGQSRSASAYCRSRSCEEVWTVADATHFKIPCVLDLENGCWAFGPPLHWPTNCLSFSVQSDGSTNAAIDLELAETVIEAAFETWALADCGGGETPSFSVRNRGSVECRRHEYNQGDGNANVFLFLDDRWPHKSVDGHQFALTTTTYDVDTGEIFDADVEFNTAAWEAFIQADFASVVTHEVGHFLGLAHSTVRETTMTGGGYHGGMATLEPDDVEGVCAIYPPDEPLSSSCPIRHGFSEKCGTPADDEGCTIGSGHGRSGTGVAPGLALFAVSFALRRLRRARLR
jgi:hypothetical protein